MRLNNYETRQDLLVDWMLETFPENARVLDVGANDGAFCPQVSRIAARAGWLAGVDSDTVKLARHPYLHERFDGLLEDAPIADASFDCVYAMFVLEHVERPERFMAALSRVLRPGGSFFFMTPNGQHYFAAIAGALGRVKLQDRVLRVLLRRELVDRYHYPALYRLNTPKRLVALGSSHGFSEFEFRYCEKFDEISPYFPGPLKVVPWMWEQMASVTRQERLLVNLMGRMVKARR
jgi:ubiquinone/menaquinone biosynthesis C-methylase UbiE